MRGVGSMEATRVRKGFLKSVAVYLWNRSMEYYPMCYPSTSNNLAPRV